MSVLSFCFHPPRESTVAVNTTHDCSSDSNPLTAICKLASVSSRGGECLFEWALSKLYSVVTVSNFWRLQFQRWQFGQYDKNPYLLRSWYPYFDCSCCLSLAWLWLPHHLFPPFSCFLVTRIWFLRHESCNFYIDFIFYTLQNFSILTSSLVFLAGEQILSPHTTLSFWSSHRFMSFHQDLGRWSCPLPWLSLISWLMSLLLGCGFPSQFTLLAWRSSILQRCGYHSSLWIFWLKL